MSDMPSSIGDVLDRLRDLATGEEVKLGQLIEAFGERSFVPALMIPALLVVSPLSGIPLFSSACGLTIALIAGQMLAARDHLWLPGFVKRRTLSSEKLRNALERVRKPVDWVDRKTKPRLRALFHRPLNWLPRLGCVLCGAMMPFLELVPFSSSTLGLAVLCFSVGFLTRDGLFTVIGAVIMGLASMIPFFVWNTIFGS